MSALWGKLATPVHTAQTLPDLDVLGSPWKDNAFFAWWDVERGVHGIVHVSTSPNTGGSRARCAVRAGAVSHEIIEDLGPGTFDSESISVDLDRGRVVVDHPDLSVELTMDPRFQALDWLSVGAVPLLRPDRPLNHFQQPFHSSGSGQVCGHEFTFDGEGVRDRSYGFRNESAQWVEYLWLSATFEDCAIVKWRALGADGEVKNFGWRVDDEAVEDLVDYSIVRNGSGMYAGGSVKTKTGEFTLETLSTPAGWWLPMGPNQTGPTFSAYDEWVVLERSDGALGVGIAEHGILRKIS